MFGRWLGRARDAAEDGAVALDEVRALERAGRIDDAKARYRHLVAVAPKNVAARLQYGRFLAKRGALSEGRQQIEAAIAVDPRAAEAYALLGNVERAAGDAVAAEHAYRRALMLDPSTLLGAHNLGVLLREQGRLKEALEMFEQSLASPGAGPMSLTLLVHCLLDLDRADDARTRLEGILAGASASPEARALLGLVLLKRFFDAPGALVCFEAAQRAGLNDAELHANRGIALQDLGRVEEAIEAYEQALQMDPALERARWQRSLARLLKGDFAAAWPDYELRLKDTRRPRRAFPYPIWQGESLAGRRILLIAEQGVGDEIMFASCVPDLVRAGAHCIIDCAPKLAPLFVRSFPGQQVRGGLQTEADVSWTRAFEPIDCQLHVGSLPRMLRNTPSDFPAHAGYLNADPKRVAAWRARFAADGVRLRVGIAWRGGTLRSRAPLRTLPLARLARALWQPGLELFSLQHDANGEEEAAIRAEGIEVHHPAEAIASFDEMAALVRSLDLVVTVCSSVVHLGGALGVPVCVLAPFSPEWRYLARGTSLPWYPSVRMFRQDRFGVWDGVLATVRRELSGAVRAHA